MTNPRGEMFHQGTCWCKKIKPAIKSPPITMFRTKGKSVPKGANAQLCSFWNAHEGS